MESRLDRAASVAVLVCAVVVAATATWQFVLKDLLGGGTTRVERVEGWSTLATRATKLFGDDSASVQIIEFVDLQCPACQAFQYTMDTLEQRHPDYVSAYYLPLPLSEIHPEARAAAVVAECVARDGHLSAFVRVALLNPPLVASQDWAALRQRAGVGESPDQQVCIEQVATALYVDSMVSTARSMGINATPTILVNGWKFEGTLTIAELDEIIARVVAGKRPRAPRPAFERAR